MKKMLLFCTLGLAALSSVAMQQPTSTPTTAQKAAVMLIMGLKIEYTKLRSELDSIPALAVTGQEAADRASALNIIIARANVAYDKIASLSQPMAAAFRSMIERAEALKNIIATTKTLPQ